ncbi:MAG: 2Fe-2S iron-sulfur cluster binding domain-containing protein [Devosia nanyangense]|uniref:2Fe-2S iron-sulfur cluster binding domain-containing protein n=1 Tax=Devosia nanyangense TaxID=1228055 RepID=A0A933L0T2_9HYPH|nr:2Fe-2S iron-sulfur cluster binding domain-containing protein [Devosia nanyangense]
MPRAPADLLDADRTAAKRAVAADAEEAALMAALTASLHHGHDCQSGGCDTCPCRFDEAAAQGGTPAVTAPHSKK